MRSMAGLWSWGVSLLVDRDARGVLERFGAGDDDLVAHLQAAGDFDRRDAGRAQRDRGADGDPVAHHVGIAAAFGFDEGAALQREHIWLFIDQQARRDALVLAQAGRLGAVEAHPRQHLVLTTSGDSADSLPVAWMSPAVISACMPRPMSAT